MIPILVLILGLKSADYPKDTNEQSAKAVEIVKDLVMRVLGRDETFSLVVRKSSQRRYAKDSTMVLVPPIEVRTDYFRQPEYHLRLLMALVILGSNVVNRSAGV